MNGQEGVGQGGPLTYMPGGLCEQLGLALSCVINVPGELVEEFDPGGE